MKYLVMGTISGRHDPEVIIAEAVGDDGDDDDDDDIETIHTAVNTLIARGVRLQDIDVYELGKPKVINTDKLRLVIKGELQLVEPSKRRQ